MRILKKALISLIAIILSALLVLCLNEYINTRVFVTDYTYASDKLPAEFDGCKILVISDLHEAPFSEQIISHIEREAPDFIVMLGDMVQLPDSSLDETLVIARAAAKMEIPVYAVSGNHDRQCGRYDEIINTLWAEDVYMLENGSVEFTKDGQSILLTGIKDPRHDIVTENKIRIIRGNIEYELSKADLFTVLLSHRADLYPHIKDTGADLILSGHLHGGVVRLPFAGGVIGQDGTLFPEYEYGITKEEGASTMIVSGGCDKNPDKKRYFNPPEVLVITLKGE